MSELDFIQLLSNALESELVIKRLPKSLNDAAAPLYSICIGENRYGFEGKSLSECVLNMRSFYAEMYFNDCIKRQNEPKTIG